MKYFQDIRFVFVSYHQLYCTSLWLEFQWIRDQRESQWTLGIDIFCPVSTGLGLDIHWFSQSRWVSVSTSEKFLSLNESRSRHPRNISVSTSLSLDIHKISKSCWVIKQRKAKQKESNQTRYNQSKSIHLLDWVCFLQHQILTFDGWVSPVREKKSRPTNQKTRIISEISMRLDGVSVSTFFAQSCFWDSDIFSLGLGLVIET